MLVTDLIMKGYKYLIVGPGNAVYGDNITAENMIRQFYQAGYSSDDIVQFIYVSLDYEGPWYPLDGIVWLSKSELQRCEKDLKYFTDKYVNNGKEAYTQVDHKIIEDWRKQFLSRVKFYKHGIS